MCVLAGSLGAFFTVWGCVRAYRAWRFLGGASRATGEIVGFERNPSSQHREYRHPVVRFETPEGRTVEFASEFGYTSIARGLGFGPEVGRGVTVLYYPLRPEKAEIHGASGTVGTPAALVASGVFCFGMLAFVLYFFLYVV
jgi:hypothetical protein